MVEQVERLLLLLALAGWLVTGVLRQRRRLGARRGAVPPRRRAPAARPAAGADARVLREV